MRLVRRAHNRNRAATLPPHTPKSLRALARRSAFSDFAIKELERVFGNGVGHAIRKIAEGNDRGIEILSEAVELIGCGSDLNNYMIFMAYTPAVHQIIDGSIKIDWMQEPANDDDIVLRCLNFVVDAAVRLGA